MNNSLFQDKMVDSDRVLYTPTSFAKKKLVHLQEIGTLHALSEHTSKRTGLASYLFFYVKSGSGTLVYNGTTYSLCTGDCVFLNCHNPYEHKTSNELWSLQWAHFYGPNLEQVYQKYEEENCSPIFRPNYIHPYEKLLSELQEISTSENYARDFMISEKLMGLLALIMSNCEQQDTNKIVPFKALVIFDIKNYLDLHFREKITLDELAGLFYIDKYYLSRRFKQHFGTTVNAYLQQAKITHAKHLLRFSQLSVEEISVECGVDDPNYFARLFKKIEGVSPGEFRRTWQGAK